MLRPADRRIDPLDLWLPPAAMAVSVAVAVRADPVLLLLDLGGCLRAPRRVDGGDRRRGGDEAVGGAGRAARVPRPRLDRDRAPAPGGSDQAAGPRADRPSAWTRLPAWAGPVRAGCSSRSLLLLFGSLFSAADTAFDRLMGRLFTWHVDLGELPIRMAIAFVVAWGVAGLLAIANGALGADGTEVGAGFREPVPQSLGAAAIGLPDADGAGQDWMPVRLGAIEAATVLIAVDILFAVFVVLQIAYLFGGQDTLAATGLPYGEYARSGFFELVSVAVLAGGLVAIVQRSRRAGRRPLVGARHRPRRPDGGRARVGAPPAPDLPGRLRLDRAPLLRSRDDRLAGDRDRDHGRPCSPATGCNGSSTASRFAAIAVLVAINIVGPSRLIAEQNVARVLDPSLVPADGRSGLDVAYAVAPGRRRDPGPRRGAAGARPIERQQLEGCAAAPAGGTAPRRHDRLARLESWPRGGAGRARHRSIADRPTGSRNGARR